MNDNILNKILIEWGDSQTPSQDGIISAKNIDLSVTFDGALIPTAVHWNALFRENPEILEKVKDVISDIVETFKNPQMDNNWKNEAHSGKTLVRWVPAIILNKILRDKLNLNVGNISDEYSGLYWQFTDINKEGYLNIEKKLKKYTFFVIERDPWTGLNDYFIIYNKPIYGKDEDKFILIFRTWLSKNEFDQSCIKLAILLSVVKL